jgi:hypothetical protein
MAVRTSSKRPSSQGSARQTAQKEQEAEQPRSSRSAAGADATEQHCSKGQAQEQPGALEQPSNRKTRAGEEAEAGARLSVQACGGATGSVAEAASRSRGGGRRRSGRVRRG